LRDFVSKAEALMNVHVSYRLHRIPSVEKDIQHQIERLQKRLHVFRPELIHLKGSVEENSPREGTTVSLNLRLPSGQMAVQKSASTATAAVKVAFEDLLQQLNKHKELLRSSHKWQRRRSAASDRYPPQIPFEQTVAVVYPPTVSAEDVRSYVNVNLSRLELFVEREIYFREAQEQMERGAVTKDEVIDETIAAALDSNIEKPEKMRLEPWLYRLALMALTELTRPVGSNDGNSVHLEESARPRDVKASDEPQLQFHQPDETITGENVIADGRMKTPEQIVASDEMMRVIATALRGAGAGPREAFILYAIEGFAIEEIAVITAQPPDRVLTCISSAREHLRKSPGLSQQLRGQFIPSGAA
jgi:DNA-directed RNA polymerase specialized sigma24 family protein/ribosome-associated translation inhibitor RaiA